MANLSVDRILATATFLVLVGCSSPKQESKLPTTENVVTAEETRADRKIGDARVQYGALGKDALQKRILEGTLLEPSSAKGQTLLSSLARVQLALADAPARAEGDAALVLGYPVDLLDEHQVFGGVITQVSDRENETLGDLKLTDLSPLHVRTRLAKTPSGSFALALFGCVEKCTEASVQLPLMAIPVVAVDPNKASVYLDIATLGSELNLLEMLDPDGEYTQLKTESSKVVSLDYSLSTLVFDIEVKMVPKDAAASEVRDTVFTIRWYLRLASTFNPAFEVRTPVTEVGFFNTERSLQPKISRFSVFQLGAGVSGSSELGPVHYYVKNVPAEHRASFKAAFDEWNSRFQESVGYRLLDYTFVADNDPAAKLLVAGDVRYNILEWDLQNEASYGGLGPSIANQFTGEIFSANTLIQGPAILKIYKAWFKVNETVVALRREGRDAEADAALAAYRRGLPSEKARPELKLNLGRKLAFRIPSRLPEFQDPLEQKDNFEELPIGQTFESYMHGYFQEMVAHELGHNLGLRHNFRGNLTSKGAPSLGGVSSSIMEYLGRPFRFLNRIGEYDVMAIRYGYAGTTPTKKGMFCTDENVPRKATDVGSAECSSDDATGDPFSYFESVLQRVIDRLIARGTPEAPTWNKEDLDREITKAINGLALYSVTAEKTSTEWSQFHLVADRPKAPAEIRSYVFQAIRSQLCGAVDIEISQKPSQAAKDAATKNMNDLRKRAEELLKTLTVLSATAGVC